MHARNRQTGLEIVATSERLYGLAKIEPDSWRRAPDTHHLKYEHDGSGTNFDWDSAETVSFIDKDGNECQSADIEMFDPSACVVCGYCLKTIPTGSYFYSVDDIQVCEACRAKVEALGPPKLGDTVTLRGRSWNVTAIGVEGEVMMRRASTAD